MSALLLVSSVGRMGICSYDTVGMCPGTWGRSDQWATSVDNCSFACHTEQLCRNNPVTIQGLPSAREIKLQVVYR